MSIIISSNQLEQRLNTIRDHFDEQIQFIPHVSDIAGILKLEIKLNWTVESSNSNFQINYDHVKDFFPSLSISEAFPHQRVSLVGKTPGSSGLSEGIIAIRQKIQNTYPYLQIALEGELSELKRSLKTGDMLLFIRKAQSGEYLLLHSSEDVFHEAQFLVINDQVASSDRSHFVPSNEVAEVAPNTFEDLNIVYYGAPGTGKSYTIKTMLEQEDEDRIERVTFHPEYDYLSFVGGYRPASITNKKGEDSITYRFVPQAFTNIYIKAWNDPSQPYFLVIEEINRGNCAAIFGDIFQLLDRTSNYAITPSQELSDFLLTSLGEEHKGFRNRKLQLPPNLYLLATMNTSDQSLFPMDSAFKRRWSWEYIPINYSRDSSINPSAKFRVELDSGDSFLWIDFIERVNKDHIQEDPNLGEDKCIGNYFIDPPGERISLAIFINKAISYLWMDVFKDLPNELFKEGITYPDFFPIGVNGITRIRDMLGRLGVTIARNPDSRESSTDADSN
jgi:hypothetical protein